jgi:catechol 2,3-dioxygenase
MERTNLTSEYRLPPSAHVGGIHLRVSDLKRSTHFYGDLVGFRVIENSNAMATLGGAVDHNAVITLTESAARPRASRSAGLFHVAFRYAGRKELATALWRFLKHRYPIDGAADHLVSDAIYLEDPDGNGVELYCDHPRDTWARHGDQLAMSTEPLDVEALLAESSGADEGESDGEKGRVEIGHVHLQVTDLVPSERFYHELLGFDVTQRTFPGALFLSAGGYHHHIGVNTWSTRGGGPADQESLGLISFMINIGDPDALRELRARIEVSGNIVNVSHSTSSTDPVTVLDPDRIGIQLIV